MIPIDIDYDTYYAKHCARYYGWLPASKAYQQEINKKSLKYFTLCARQAIDVFMLEKHGVLLRDNNGKLANVIICEEKEHDWTEIIRVVRPPVQEAVIMGKLEDLLLYQDDDEVRQLLQEGDSARPNKAQREKLDRRERAQRLKDQFPFDIINFDPCGSLLDSELKANNLYQAFQRIFELQKSIGTFLLFITTKITDIHPDVQSQFRETFKVNVSKYPKIRETLLSSVGTTAYDGTDENKRAAFGFAKSIVMQVAKSKEWSFEHQGIYIYDYKTGPTRMLSSVVKLSKLETAPDESVYVEDIIRVIEQMPKYYSYEGSLENQEVKGHLEKIKEYREKSRREY